MARCLLALSLAASASTALAISANATLIWQQNEAIAVYTSSGLSRHLGTTPTFATATWLNNPYFVETFNVSEAGGTGSIWEYDFPNPTQGTIPSFQTTMSRHAVGFGPGVQVVDTVAGEGNFVKPSNCSVYGWNSQTTSTPVWTWSLPDCSSNLLYDEYRMVSVSDDGSIAAFSGFVGAANTPSLTAFNAQTGAVLFSKGPADAGSGAGTVGISSAGAYLTWTSAKGLLVYDVAATTLRATVPASGPNDISDSGDFVATCAYDSASIFKWDGSGKTYTLDASYVPSATNASANWFCVDAALSSDGSGAEDAELAAFAWISQDVFTSRVTIYSMVTGKLLTDWSTTKSSSLQNNPTIRMDEQYVGVALWGDQNEAGDPSVVLLSAGTPTPLFGYSTPGSMFGVDVVVDHAASTPTKDVVYFAVAGKHTPANEMGNGGDAYAWRVDVTL